MTNTDNLTPLGINPVADILEALMNKHRLSQTALSNRSGVSQPAINRILNERSRAKHPRKETLQKIADVLGVTPDQLMGQEPISSRTMAREAVPVLSWDNLAQKTRSTQDDWLACPIEHGNETFALPVLGEAMTGEDGYREGDIIFLDPCIPPTHGKDVVVLKGSTALFRRFTVTPEGCFLKTLNPSWPAPILELPSDAIYCGTVIFSGRAR